MKTVKAIGFLTLFAVTLFVGYVRHWSNIETSLALLCIVVLFLGVEITKLTEASSKTVRDNHAKIIKQIEQGQAVEPNPDLEA
jgi:cadmium resistance protein CadD (predicted permease)